MLAPPERSLYSPWLPQGAGRSAITQSSPVSLATKEEMEDCQTLMRLMLSILSANTPEGLALAVMKNNEKALTVAPGIGKKIAQRVILELKDKIGAESAAVDLPAPVQVPVGESGAVNDAVSALGVLGYSSSEIAPLLKKLDLSGMSSEQIIKAVLKSMVK